MLLLLCGILLLWLIFWLCLICGNGLFRSLRMFGGVFFGVVVSLDLGFVFGVFLVVVGMVIRVEVIVMVWYSLIMFFIGFFYYGLCVFLFLGGVCRIWFGVGYFLDCCVKLWFVWLIGVGVGLLLIFV